MSGCLFNASAQEVLRVFALGSGDDFLIISVILCAVSGMGSGRPFEQSARAAPPSCATAQQ
jgi:hypothetical protein